VSRQNLVCGPGTTAVTRHHHLDKSSGSTNDATRAGHSIPAAYGVAHPNFKLRDSSSQGGRQLAPLRHHGGAPAEFSRASINDQIQCLSILAPLIAQQYRPLLTHDSFPSFLIPNQADDPGIPTCTWRRQIELTSLFQGTKPNVSSSLPLSRTGERDGLQC
jgi:hypothetical protein